MVMVEDDDVAKRAVVVPMKRAAAGREVEWNAVDRVVNSDVKRAARCIANDQ